MEQPNSSLSSRRAALGRAEWSQIPTQKAQDFHFGDIHLVPLYLGSLLVSTYDFPSIYSIVSTTLRNYRQKTKLDNPNFKLLMGHYLMLFFCFFRWKTVEDVFPGNLLVEFTASFCTLSDGYAWLFTITIKSLVLVLITSFRNEVLYFRLMNSCPLCWKFKKAPPSIAWKAWYISWTRRISSGIQDSWAQFYD